MSALASVPVLSSGGGALIASASRSLREQISYRLQGRCRPVLQAMGGADALAKLEKGEWQVFFVDRRLPDLDAEEVVAISQRRFPKIQIVLLDSEAEAAEERGGERNSPRPASEPLSSPAGADRGEITAAEPIPGMIGQSKVMRQVYRMVRLVAARNTAVLVTGPTGTGKELVARALHALGPRAGKPLVVVNCAAIPETLLESELFGYVRGAFTGALQSQMGRIAAADGGTLFLDEVSELPLGMQAKLLRFLEQKEVQRLGTCQSARVDARVVAASNVDLPGRVARGLFRPDLFYRLSAFPIELPALAERRADIVPLAEYFLDCMAAAMDMRTPRLSADAVRRLEAHPWPGNVRELQHVMERASILAEGAEIIAGEHLCLGELLSANLLPEL